MIRIGTAVAAGIFAVTLLAGFLAAPVIGADTMSQMQEFVAPLKGRGWADILAFIFINNAVKSLVALVFGGLLGLPTLFFVATNGMAIGVIAATVAESSGYSRVVAALLPHGIIEIPALLLAAGMGFALAAEVLKRVTGRRSGIRAMLKRCLRLYGIAVAPALAVAAIIEVFVTPTVVKIVLG